MAICASTVATMQRQSITSFLSARAALMSRITYWQRVRDAITRKATE